MGQRERPTGTLGTSRLQTTGSWSVFKQVGVLSNPFVPPYTGRMRAWSVARTLFGRFL